MKNKTAMKPALLPDLTGLDFTAAGQSVLRFLHARFGFGLWMLTRVEGEAQLVLQSENHGYGIGAGSMFRWEDTFCVHMVASAAPRIAPHSNQIPAYGCAIRPAAWQQLMKKPISGCTPTSVVGQHRFAEVILFFNRKNHL